MGLHSKDKRQKGLRKIANACRLTFCLVCDQSIYLYIAQISNISSMRPSISNSMSSIAMTVLLIKESGVMGPQDTAEVTHQLGCPGVMLIFVRKSSLQSLEFIALVTKGMGHTQQETAVKAMWWGGSGATVWRPRVSFKSSPSTRKSCSSISHSVFSIKRGS